jgi:NAD(P)-dependent dehydrogenase (short-subunit alcohol dehydrogenase family)
VKEFGAVDILVNNAQSFAGPNTKTNGDGAQPFETFDEEDWEVIYRTGVLSTLWAMKAVFPHMKGRGGKIINIGSLAGQTGVEGFAAYGMAKEGIRSMTRTAAREWGKHKINVNVINPTILSEALADLVKNQPEMMEKVRATVPVGYFGDPVKDTGPIAIFLGSSDSDYITGMTFMLNGGQTMFP